MRIGIVGPGRITVIHARNLAQHPDADEISGIRRKGTGHDVRLQVYGTGNIVSAGLDARTPVTSTEPGVPGAVSTYNDFNNRFEPAFRNEADHFLRVIRGTAPNLTSPRAGLVAIRIAVAAEESRRTGQPAAITD